MRILVLGGDGYIGWPLSLKLALSHASAEVWMADNGLRRRMVAEVGGNSVTPILAMDERLAAFRRVFGQDNLHFAELDVAGPGLSGLIAELRPEIVYHLAQQGSAPYSMLDVDHALFTIQNNEGGNMRLLWALREHAPGAHLVKLGTFGEYAKGGIDIAEGYFLPSYNGKTASRPLPYPRESDDIYHISKINDSNYISLACRKWGLAVTDIMQSTIFGVHTEETSMSDALVTRCDYDAVWGTVVNRFIAQSVLGYPLTVYGTGLQRTGLMALADSVRSLATIAEKRPNSGEHRVINHVTERSWCINEVAEQVARVAGTHGISTEVRRDHNPRAENDTKKAEYGIENHYVSSCVAHTPFDEAVAPLFAAVARWKHNVRAEVFPPTVRWSRG
jgi:UDP-sulfoquinovose synthase